MANKTLSPDLIFETSWEVCNKVGGIYTVLSSRAKTLQKKYPDNIFFIGPDLWRGKSNPLFNEDSSLLTAWRQVAHGENMEVRIGRWNIPGQPIVILIDFSAFFNKKNEIYGNAWEDFGVDSLHAYGDYDEASMFSFAAGRFVEIIYKEYLANSAKKVIYQAHEWMSGLGMLYLKKQIPQIATIFTTHATSIGRSIAGNNKLLYEYFEGYNGDQMARELNMEAKHSIEKKSAWGADCFTTVSAFTNTECKQLLDKAADVVLPNGFESDFVPKSTSFSAKRKAARKQILRVASQLIGEELHDSTLIISTSGRNDFRCKGFDVYLESLAQLNARLKKTEEKVLALIEVPCWLLGPRQDLRERLASTSLSETPLPIPIISHDLHNINEDRIVGMIRQLGLDNSKENPVKVILVPCYLEGNDGIFNMSYYDLLTANDLSVYPSYYEPWGYTPLESIAFHTPCLTTDLSGFGQWTNELLGHEGELSDGVKVIHRTDTNYFKVASDIADTVEQMLYTPIRERKAIRECATKISEKALWKHFIKHYYEAYAFALNRVEEQQRNINSQFL